MIRHYIEPIGSLTGTDADPLNECAAKEMLWHLARIVPGIELPHAWKFAAHIRPTLTDEPTRKTAGSSMLIGLQCAPDSCGVDVMAGLMTQAPCQVKVLLDTILPRAIWDAYGEDASLDGLNMVRDFIQTDHQGSHLTVLGTTAINCCAMAASQFRVYMTTSNTSFNHFAAIMTLGGRKTELPKSVSQIKELWYGLKGSPANFSTTLGSPSSVSGAATSNANANVSSVTFYFDIHPRYSLPHVKLQVDVSKHSMSDMGAIQAVMGFLERRGQGGEARAYLRVVLGMVSEEELRTRRGLQAFFAFAFKGGNINITSNFLPQIYRRFAETQASSPWSNGSRRRSRFESY